MARHSVFHLILSSWDCWKLQSFDEWLPFVKAHGCVRVTLSLWADFDCDRPYLLLLLAMSPLTVLL